jgi:hypothetical protein
MCERVTADQHEQLEADIDRREHAITETVFADVVDGRLPVAYFRIGRATDVMVDSIV